MEIYPWCIDLMEGILNNHLLMVPPVVKSKMLNLSKMEANTIGRKLAKALKGKRTAEAGVDQWMLAHQAMIEMNKKYKFFIPMIIVIGRQKVMDAPWGMKFRVYFGAFISILGKLSILFLSLEPTLSFTRDLRLTHSPRPYFSLFALCRHANRHSNYYAIF